MIAVCVCVERHGNSPLYEGQVQRPLFTALTRYFIMVSCSPALGSPLVTLTHVHTRQRACVRREKVAAEAFELLIYDHLLFVFV